MPFAATTVSRPYLHKLRPHCGKSQNALKRYTTPLLFSGIFSFGSRRPIFTGIFSPLSSPTPSTLKATLICITFDRFMFSIRVYARAFTSAESTVTWKWATQQVPPSTPMKKEIPNSIPANCAHDLVSALFLPQTKTQIKVTTVSKVSLFSFFQKTTTQNSTENKKYS